MDITNSLLVAMMFVMVLSMGIGTLLGSLQCPRGQRLEFRSQRRVPAVEKTEQGDHRNDLELLLGIEMTTQIREHRIAYTAG